MSNFLSGLGNGFGTLIGGGGNQGAAASNAWNYGQYSPFTLNNPMGSVGWNGTTGMSSLSPLQSSIQTALGNNVLNGQSTTDPNFLTNQYNSIYGGGNFQNNVNSQFNALQQAQAPWIAQGNQSNLDNEFSKGTLASTAGGYQTAGHDMANNSQMNQNYATAFNNASSLAGQQMSGAVNTAGQNNSLFGASLNGLDTQNSQFLQMMGLGGQLGAQRSSANTNAAIPGIAAGEQQDQYGAGFLSNLLGLGSSSGLLGSLLGSNGSNGVLGSLLGKAGSGISSLFGGSGTNYGSDYNNQAMTDIQNNDPTQSMWNNIDDGNAADSTAWWDGTGFSGAGGQAANLQNLGVDDVNELGSVQSALNGSSSGSSSPAMGGYLGSALGAYQGLMKGGVTGYGQAAASGLSGAGKLLGNSSLSGAAGVLGGGLGLYNGIQNLRNGNGVGMAQTAAGAAGAGSAAASLSGNAALAGALGASATGIGAIAALPAVTQLMTGAGSALFDAIGLGGKASPSISALLDGKSGYTQSAPTNGGGIAGMSGVQGYFQGKKVNLSDADRTQAVNLYQSGNISAFDQFMQSKEV